MCAVDGTHQGFCGLDCIPIDYAMQNSAIDANRVSGSDLALTFDPRSYLTLYI